MDFTIDPGHPALPGHFPGRPVVPGVVILDQVLAAIEAAHGPQALRQAQSSPSTRSGGEYALLRLPQVKFLRPLLPGQAARIELEPCAVPGGDVGAAPRRWRFRVLADDGLLASGEVAAA